MADKFSPTISTALPGYSKGAQIGESMGTGLGQGLQFLLQDKMNRMMQAKQEKKIASGLESLLGPEQAKALSGVSEPLLRAIIPQIQKQQQTQKLMDQYQAGGVSGGATGTRGSGSEFQRVLAMTGGNVQAALKAEADAKKLELEERKFKFKKEQGIRKRKAELRKELAPERKKVQQSKEMDVRTVESIRSAQSGKMRAGTTQIFMDRLNMGEAFRNPTTEAGQKNLEGFALGVATAFGSGMGRIMKAEFDAFVKANANKFNSVEAISYIGHMNLLKNQLVYERNRIKKEIIEKNDNDIPYDIDEQIDKVIMPLEKNIQSKMRILNQFLTADQLPSWNKVEKGNPALWKEGSTANLPTPSGKKVPMIIKDGMWFVDFNKLGA